MRCEFCLLLKAAQWPIVINFYIYMADSCLIWYHTASSNFYKLGLFSHLTPDHFFFLYIIGFHIFVFCVPDESKSCNDLWTQENYKVLFSIRQVWEQMQIHKDIMFCWSTLKLYFSEFTPVIVPYLILSNRSKSIFLPDLAGNILVIHYIEKAGQHHHNCSILN